MCKEMRGQPCEESAKSFLEREAARTDLELEPRVLLSDGKEPREVGSEVVRLRSLLC